VSVHFLASCGVCVALAGTVAACAGDLGPGFTSSSSASAGGDLATGGDAPTASGGSGDAASTSGGMSVASLDNANLWNELPCDPDSYWTPNAKHVTEAPGVGGCPAGMIPVETFCVDRYEASLVYADTGESFSPYQNPGVTAVRAVSVGGAIPQAYIDGDQAGAACEAAGKRLCSDDEWLRACRGPSDYTYPYGDHLMLGVCNDHRAEHPAIEYFGTSDSWIWSELGNACIDQLHDSLEPTGSHPGCETSEGAFDMMGNLHEWTADPAGTFRGGYYVDTMINGPGCLYVTTAHNTLHWDYSTGFRCCF
jgi:sulfatase modifying factor 1